MKGGAGASDLNTLSHFLQFCQLLDSCIEPQKYYNFLYLGQWK
jgi:hypothetical protein